MDPAPNSAKPVALVTGGSRGIGRGICLALGQHGYAVAINYAGNEEAARETQRLLGPDVESLLCQADSRDLTRFAGCFASDRHRSESTRRPCRASTSSAARTPWSNASSNSATPLRSLCAK